MSYIDFIHWNSDELPAEENFTSPVASHDTSGSEGSEAASGGVSEEFKTPPQEKQEAVNNPPQKVREICIHNLHSDIRATLTADKDCMESSKIFVVEIVLNIGFRLWPSVYQ